MFEVIVFMKVVIVGNGKVGNSLAERLSSEGHDVVVIDNDPDNLKNSDTRMDIITVLGNGVSYTCWIFFLNIFPIHAYVLWRHGGTYISYLRKRAATGLFGGLCGLGSYGIALWAMTLAPIALVAALRETSVIFGMLLAVIFLHERLSRSRIMAILIVMGGAMLIRLG